MCDAYPEFMRTREVKARLVHRCDECYRPIMRGEVYVAFAGKWDGEVETWRFHVLCHLLATQIARDEDGCMMFGEMTQAAMDINLSPFHARWFANLTGRKLESAEVQAP